MATEPGSRDGDIEFVRTGTNPIRRNVTAQATATVEIVARINTKPDATRSER
jgi:hypothetical protein